MSVAQRPPRLITAVTTLVAPVRTPGEPDQERRAEVATVPATYGGAYETTVSGDLPLIPFMRMPAPSFRKALQQHAALLLPAAFGRELAERKLRAGCIVEFLDPDEVPHKLTLSLIDRKTVAALDDREHTWEAQGSSWLGLAHFADRLAIFANTKKGGWPSMW